MKVIGIVGSPKKNSNTDLLVKEAMKAAEEKGAETAVYYVNDMNIKGCQGCFRCNEGSRCVIDDDMQTLYDAIEGSDVVVMGSPVYMFQMIGQMRIVQDRLYNYLETPAFTSRLPEGKKLGLIFTQGAEDADAYRAGFELAEKAFNLVGFRDVSSLVCPGLVRPGEVSEKPEMLKQAYNLGEGLVS